jgi:aspartyl-tRNA(Asn)/glutamyl-tRNA(Gln) amidotransferase subunit B
MQKGHMRFEPNINLIIIEEDGKQFKTPIVEVKNLNSFRALENSIDYEIGRQLDLFLETGETMEMGNKSTRGWDDVKEVTVLQREKEEAHDYRYFPDPDLVPVQVNEQWLNEIKSRLCEMPLPRRLRYVKEYGLSEYDAGVLASERATADFFESAVREGGDPKSLCNWITQHGLRLANQKACSIWDVGISPNQVSQLTRMVILGNISSTAATSITNIMTVRLGEAPQLIAERENLIQKSDAGELEGTVDEVLKNNPQAVEDFKAGGKKSGKARGFLLGQVMQKTKGRANPKVAAEILDKKLA